MEICTPSIIFVLLIVDSVAKDIIFKRMMYPRCRRGERVYRVSEEVKVVQGSNPAHRQLDECQT